MRYPVVVDREEIKIPAGYDLSHIHLRQKLIVDINTMLRCEVNNVETLVIGWGIQGSGIAARQIPGPTVGVTCYCKVIGLCSGGLTRTQNKPVIRMIRVIA